MRAARYWVERLEGLPTAVIVNDRVDVALAVGAEGHRRYVGPVVPLAVGTDHGDPVRPQALLPRGLARPARRLVPALRRVLVPAALLRRRRSSTVTVVVGVTDQNASFLDGCLESLASGLSAARAARELRDAVDRGRVRERELRDGLRQLGGQVVLCLHDELLLPGTHETGWCRPAREPAVSHLHRPRAVEVDDVVFHRDFLASK